MNKFFCQFRRMMALLMVFLMMFSAIPAGAANTSESLADAYQNLFDTTLDSMEELLDYTLNEDPDLVDVFKVILQTAKQVQAEAELLVALADELYTLNAQRIESLYGHYMSMMSDHMANLLLTTKYVVNDARTYGAVKQQKTIDYLSGISNSIYTSYTSFSKSINEFRNSATCTILCTKAEKDLLDNMIRFSSKVFDEGQHIYAGRYSVSFDEYVEKAPVPALVSVKNTMNSQVTGSPISMALTTTSFSKLSYSIGWYKDDVLKTTVTNPSVTYSEDEPGLYTAKAKTNYTPASAGVWHAKVTVTDKLGRSKVFTSNELTVSQSVIKPTKLTMSTSGATLGKDKTLQLSVNFTPVNATEKNITWTSSNTKVATVSSTGLVKAVGEGTATIKATSTANTSLSCSATINVSGYFEDLYMSNIGTNNAQINCMLTDFYVLTECGFSIGTSATNLSTKKVEDLSDSGTTVKLIWYDMNNWGVTLKAGTTYYYQFYIVKGGTTYKSSIQSFKTSDIPVTKITLSDGAVAMEKGDTKTITPTFTPNNATSGREVAWQSSDPEVASISSAGVITALDGGTATITAVSVADASITASLTVDVHDPEDDVAISEFGFDSESVYVGDTVICTATVTGNTNGVLYNYVLLCGNEVVQNIENSNDAACTFLIMEPGVYAATVTAIADSGNVSKTSKELTVKYRYTGLTASRSSVFAEVGSSVRINYTVQPSNSELIAERGTLDVFSTQPGVASVTSGSNATKGTLYGDVALAATGWTTIYADAGVGSEKRIAVDVHVTDDQSLILPDDIGDIEEEAFMNAGGFTNVHIFGSSNVSIGERAFANCKGLKVVCLGNNVTSIADNAFSGCDITIYCTADSAAYEFAVDNSIPVRIVR